MLLGYGGYLCSASIFGSGSPAPAFLTDPANLFDCRSGSVATMTWTGGAQTTSTYTALTITIVDPFATAAIPLGVVGLANVVGLPLGTKIVFNGVTQRLVPGPRGEPCAWWLPNIHTSSTCQITAYNDVGGSTSAAITAGMTWGIGEIFIGRLMYLPTLVASNPPLADAFDPTAHNSSSGGQDWQLMRNPRRIISANLGYFSTKDAKGGSTSSIVSGAYPAGVIDIQTLRELLLKTSVCAVCDTPSAGQGAGNVVNGISYDQDFMQGNWMVARPRLLSQIPHTQPPKWSWPTAWMEAT